MGYNLINIYNATDKTLFDDITLYDKIDKETLVNTIFDEAGELETVTSYPVLFKLKVENFFKRNYTNFKHIYDAFLLEYEPIENYNRLSEITVTDEGTVNRTGNRNNTVTVDGTNTTTNDLQTERTDALKSQRTDDLRNTDANTLHGEVETKVSAFNTSDYSPKEKQITDNSTTDTATQTGTSTTDNTGTQTQKDTGSSTLKQDGTTKTVETDGDDTTHSNTNKTSDHTHGNIGVTTSQQMLQSEIDLWIAFNAYKAMADYFIKELMISVL